MGLLMKTFFAGELSPEENIERFRHIQAGCDEFLKGLSKADSAVDRYRPVLSKTPEKSMYWNMTISFGRKYMKMLKKWCSECISELEEFQK